jgi:ribosomal protein S12 methylthiotransferase
VPAELKAERRARFMELAAEISAARLQQKIGRTLPVLIDGIDAKNDIAIARSASDAPEIDGTVRIAGARRAGRLLAVGSLVDVQITAAGDYDLEARLIDPIN